MSTKQVCQLDAEGYFVSITEADESPLEPGVWLIPAGAVDSEIPNIPDGYKAKWSGSGFDLEQIPIEPEPEPPLPPTKIASVTMAQARQALIDAELDEVVEQMIQQMSGKEGKKARAKWEHAQTVQRDDPLFIALAAGLDLSEQDLDNLFLAASQY